MECSFSFYLSCCCCFDSLRLKVLEIIIITLHSISIILIILCFILMKWSKFPKVHITLFLILFFINLTCDIVVIVLRFWRKNKEMRKGNETLNIVLPNICYLLSIIGFFAAILEYIILSIWLSDENNKMVLKESIISRLTLNFSVLGFLFLISFWSYLSKRIKLRKNNKNIGQITAKRKVIVF